MRKNSLLVLVIAATKGKLRLQKINWYIIFSYYFLACDIWYMREPVSSVQCNPFSGTSMFALQCVAQAPGSVGLRLGIVWFFTNTGENTVPINRNTFPPHRSIASWYQTVMNGKLIELTSTITLGRLSDPIHAGRYYCQAQVDGATSSLTPSNALTFTASDSVFNLNPCGVELGNFTQASTRCAESISSSTVFMPSSTVTPTSTSQSGHSTSSPPTVPSSVLATFPTTDNIFSTEITTTVSIQSPVLSSVLATSPTTDNIFSTDITTTVSIQSPVLSSLLATSPTSVNIFSTDITTTVSIQSPVLSSVLATSPTTDNIFSTDVTTTVSTQPLPGQLSLSLWVYVLVGVAAVFAMIILVLTLLIIGLYLKKKKTSCNRELAKLCKFKNIYWKIFRLAKYYFCIVFCKQKYMHMSDNQLSCHLVTLKITSGTYFCCVLCYC